MDMNAVIFVPALAGSVICGFFFLMFASHYFLTIMESTGVGAKEVTWFSEPILDNAWTMPSIRRKISVSPSVSDNSS